MLLLSSTFFIILSGVQAHQCHWCGPLAEQVHRSRRAPPCHEPGDHVATCDPPYPYCAIVATSPPYVESRYCVKIYQDECYPLFCNSTKTWRMTCPCRGDLCNGANSEREIDSFGLLSKLVAKTHNSRIKKRSTESENQLADVPPDGENIFFVDNVTTNNVEAETIEESSKINNEISNNSNVLLYAPSVYLNKDSNNLDEEIIVENNQLTINSTDDINISAENEGNPNMMQAHELMNIPFDIKAENIVTNTDIFHDKQELTTENILEKQTTPKVQMTAEFNIPLVKSTKANNLEEEIIVENNHLSNNSTDDINISAENEGNPNMMQADEHIKIPFDIKAENIVTNTEILSDKQEFTTENILEKQTTHKVQITAEFNKPIVKSTKANNLDNEIIDENNHLSINSTDDINISAENEGNLNMMQADEPMKIPFDIKAKQIVTNTEILRDKQEFTTENILEKQTSHKVQITAEFNIPIVKSTKANNSDNEIIVENNHLSINSTDDINISAENEGNPNMMQADEPMKIPFDIKAENIVTNTEILSDKQEFTTENILEKQTTHKVQITAEFNNPIVKSTKANNLDNEIIEENNHLSINSTDDINISAENEGNLNMMQADEPMKIPFDIKTEQIVTNTEILSDKQEFTTEKILEKQTKSQVQITAEFNIPIVKSTKATNEIVDEKGLENETKEKLPTAEALQHNENQSSKSTTSDSQDLDMKTVTAAETTVSYTTPSTLLTTLSTKTMNRPTNVLPKEGKNSANILTAHMMFPVVSLCILRLTF